MFLAELFIKSLKSTEALRVWTTGMSSCGISWRCLTYRLL